MKRAKAKRFRYSAKSNAALALLRDLLRLLRLMMRSRTHLAAENLFLQKQLACHIERRSDRDGLAMRRNIQTVRTAPRPPSQNACVERGIGSIRWEFLDHVIDANTVGLHRVHRVRRVLHALANTSRVNAHHRDPYRLLVSHDRVRPLHM
jgi:hypothetical protein